LKNYLINNYKIIGDWGLGIGPNPQSPIPNPQFEYLKLLINLKHITLHNI